MRWQLGAEVLAGLQFPKLADGSKLPFLFCSIFRKLSVAYLDFLLEGNFFLFLSNFDKMNVVRVLIYQVPQIHKAALWQASPVSHHLSCL